MTQTRAADSRMWSLTELGAPGGASFPQKALVAESPASSSRFQSFPENRFRLQGVEKQSYYFGFIAFLTSVSFASLLTVDGGSEEVEGR